MRNFSFEDTKNNITWTRISKPAAKAAWNNGARLLIYPHGHLSHIFSGAGRTKEEMLNAAFDYYTSELHKYMELPKSTYFDFYVALTPIPPFYNNQEYSLPSNEGDDRKGTLYYLCDKPDVKLTELIRWTNSSIQFPTAKSQYAPEQTKPLLFVPYGTYIDYM